ncbi:metallophosphoesterase [Acidithiobacillus sp.]|uniref:metallophosphoesterase n=1 Tax=Acidithiobacillus sp. TaxID=1872118 RepID=UPI0025B850BB|nr:metallophosphoesterase [Acidithiobacillus sp.]
MRIAFASDLHLEFEPDLTGLDLPHSDVLILAGDVETNPENASKAFDVLRRLHAGPILYVLGNHEYYGGVFPKRLDEYRSALQSDPSIFLLEKSSIVIDGVRFLGTTLWTDFAEGWHLNNCQSGLSDFRVIRAASGDAFSANDAWREHQKCRSWLDEEFHQPFRGPTVAITHHAPSFRSQHPRFAHSTIGGGFCSNLDAQIMQWQPDLWIHGHLHDPADYRIGETRVLCNPWGYADEGLDRRFSCVDLLTVYARRKPRP